MPTWKVDLCLLDDPREIEVLARKMAKEERKKREPSGGVRKERKRQEGSPTQWPYNKETHRFKTPCGKVIRPTDKPQGSIKIEDSWMIVKRPLGCIQCMEESFDEHYDKCLTHAALRNWPGWTIVEQPL
jgi:hypothetical protein